MQVTIRNDEDAKALLDALQSQEYPYTLTFKAGEMSRSNRQNRLQWQWYKDAEKQGDQTAREYRAYCKAFFGVPILLSENDDFAIQYNEIIRPLAYEEKLALMQPPIDLPVTSLMGVKQMSSFLDSVWNHFTGLGMILTDPQLMGLEHGRY